MEMTKALDGMTADEAYDWFQGILEEDIRNWRNPWGKTLDDSVEWARGLGDELERLYDVCRRYGLLLFVVYVPT